MERRAALKRTALVAGSAILAPSLVSLLQSCQQQSELNWQPTFLNKEQAELTTALVDTILPKTQTSGALDLKVDQFIDLVIHKVYDKAGQQSMIADMNQFDTRCKEKFGRKFSQLNANERKEILKVEEMAGAKYNGDVWGTAVGVQKPVGFYRTIKSLALWGYFTTEEIGKNVLNYDPVPGDYKGCIPLSDVGNAWSL